MPEEHVQAVAQHDLGGVFKLGHIREEPAAPPDQQHRNDADDHEERQGQLTRKKHWPFLASAFCIVFARSHLHAAFTQYTRYVPFELCAPVPRWLPFDPWAPALPSA